MNILMINQPLNNRGDESAHKALLRAVCKEKKHKNLMGMVGQFLQEMNGLLLQDC